MKFFSNKKKSKKPRVPKQTRGTVDSCACPWCRKPLDFSDLEDFGLESGNVFECDHCKRHCKLVRVKPVTLVWLSRAR